MTSTERTVSLAAADSPITALASAVPGGAEPWRGYDGQPVKTITRFVAKSPPSQARAVRTYERVHMGRIDVIEAVDQRLTKLHA